MPDTATAPDAPPGSVIVPRCDTALPASTSPVSFTTVRSSAAFAEALSRTTPPWAMIAPPFLTSAASAARLTSKCTRSPPALSATVPPGAKYTPFG